MKKLIVQQVEGYNYYLLDENETTHILNIEFYSKYKPQVNDIIYVDDTIIEEINLFAFDDITDTNDINEKDVIKVVNNDKEYYLIRVYG